MSKELIQRAKKGDADALNELIEKHKSIAFSIAFKYLKNKEDAEDITQNAFITVLGSIKKFRNESKFSTWLYKIIYHECLKVLKSRSPMIEYMPEFTQIEVTELKDETKKVDYKIDELLSHLNPNEYTIITLFYLKEKSIKEIREITSFSKANIKVILHRARTKLKEIYKP